MGYEKLSPREHELLSLYAKGLSRADAARNLGISIETVKVHTRHVFEKRGVNSIPQAVFIGVRDETIDLGEALSVVDLAQVQKNSA